MHDTVIEVSELSKTYTLGEIEVRALRQTGFRIERGEFVAVMGASGSGKSTLMNILGCLDRPTSGRYLLEGVDVASLNDEQLALIRSRRIGFIFQSFNLLSRTSAIENVELPLFYSGWPRDGEQRARALLAMLGLTGRERNHPNQLSGGQQQRVAIARALINAPAILLADEPTGNLDSTNSVEIMEIITRLNRERGLTVIVVTHDPDVAVYADRVITFRDGIIVSDERNERRSISKDASATAGETSEPAPALIEMSASSAERAENVWTFAVMALTRGVPGLAPQQAARGVDDARDFHRRRGGNRDGSGGRRRTLFGGATDSESGHEPAGHPARRDYLQRGAGRFWQHFDAAGGGRRSSRQGSQRGRGGQLHRSPGGAGRVRQSQLEHQHHRHHS